MSTYMAKPETVQRSWYIIDAAGKPLGKTAVCTPLTFFAVSIAPNSHLTLTAANA